MTKREFSEMLAELMEKIEDGPNSHMSILTQINQQLELEVNVIGYDEKLHEVIIELGKSLEAIRLIVKYLLFDIEATRRERDQLRSILEDEK